jgi:hypothetical protein
MPACFLLQDRNAFVDHGERDAGAVGDVGVAADELGTRGIPASQAPQNTLDIHRVDMVALTTMQGVSPAMFAFAIYLLGVVARQVLTFIDLFLPAHRGFAQPLGH